MLVVVLLSVLVLQVIPALMETVAQHPPRAPPNPRALPPHHTQTPHDPIYPSSLQEPTHLLTDQILASGFYECFHRYHSARGHMVRSWKWKWREGREGVNAGGDSSYQSAGS